MIAGSRLQPPRILPQLLLTFLALSLLSFAQESGEISGTVLDKTGGIVAKAQLTAINPATGLERKTLTNGEGAFLLTALPPGTYVVGAKAEGFNIALVRDIELHARDRLTLTLELEVGRVTDSVEVSAEAAHLNSESATVGTVVNRQFIENMPLNGRSFQSLISLTPGVVATGASSGVGQFSINGQRADANYFMVDGVSANVGVSALGSQGAQGGGSGVQASATGGYNNIVSVDAMEEFKIETSTFAPEYGRLPGGQISIVTRSGSNAFHGTAFDYLRNTRLDANNWFNNATKTARPPERQNDFGGVLGGPIWKNKLFFFFSYEGQRLAVPMSLVNVNVPSLSARQRTAPALQPILNAYPLPNVAQCVTGTPGCDPNVAQLNTAFSNTVNMDATSVRIDYSMSTKMTVFGRWNYSPSNGISRNTPPSTYNITALDLKTYTVGQTYILKPSMTSDLRFNYTETPSGSRTLQDNYGGAVPVPDSLMFNVPGFTSANSGWSWNGRLIGGISSSNVAKATNVQYNIIETFSWIRGKHQMKFGVDFRKINPNVIRTPYTQTYLYTLTTDSWITNTPNIYTTSVFGDKNFWYYQTGFYAQDTFKLTPRLTVTYGLRWDVNPPPQASRGQHLQALNQVDGNNLAATHIQPDGTSVYKTEWIAFAPRIGVAYQLSKDPNWGRVIRGGYGLFFDTGGVAAGAAELQFANASAPNPGPFPVPAALTVPPKPATAPPWGFVTTVDPNFRLPYTHQWNIAIEQALGRKQSLSVTYAAAVARELARRDQYFATTEFPQGFYAVGNESYSDYHSMQVQFQRRLSRGLQAMAAYTWAHSTDTGSIQIGTSAINRFLEPVSDYHGNSDFDIRHSFQTAVSYRVPSPGNRFLDAVFGHWGLDTIFRVRSANPIDLVESNAYLAAGQPFLPGTTTSNPYGVRFSIRPNTIPGVPIEISDPNAPGGKRLNRSAFVILPANTVVPTQGTLGRNFLRGFGWNQLDVSVRREFPIHENIKLQFRTDFFNAFNHPSFYFSTGFFGSNPLDIANPTFGTANGTLNTSLGGTSLVPQGQSSLFQIGGPRSIQLSMKLVF